MDAWLREMVERRRGEVEQAKSRTPFAELEAAVAQADPPRNFFGAVTRPADPRRFSIIAEIARTDEAGRPLRPEFAAGSPPPPAGQPAAAASRGEFDPVAIARGYHAGGAAAISVVTDPERGAALGELEAIREAAPLPVLRSDVLIDPWQLWESRAAGADAVRLIAECLTEGQLVDMMILAQQLRLTTVLEVRSTEGLLRVRPYVGFPHRAYSLLAINNRAMATGAGPAPAPDAPSASAPAPSAPPATNRPAAPPPPDVAVTIRHLDLVDDPAVLASEGGVRDRSDVLRLMGRGVRIALCGEELLGRPDPVAALRELNGLHVR